MEVNPETLQLSNIQVGELLHEESVQLYNQTYKLIITSAELSLRPNKTDHITYRWQDILGAKLLQKGPSTLVTLLSFPLTSPTKRKFQSHELTSQSPEQLVKIIQNMAFLGKMPESASAPYIKKFKVIINPHSGRELARSVWERVSKLFSCCEVSVSYTTHHNHGAEIVADLDLSLFHGIIVVSGDGLMHEVINALCKRPNSAEARSFPVGIISAGTGNALAQVVCARLGEKVTAEVCGYICIKGISVAMDISRVKYPNGDIIYSFLCFFWAFIADTNIGSEPCRCCGVCRYDCYGFWRLIALKSYNGTVKWGDGEYSGRMVYFIACNMPYMSIDMHVAPRSEIDDGTNDLLMLGDVGRLGLMKVLLRQDAGTHVNSPDLRYVKAKKWSISSEGNRGVYLIDGEVYPVGDIKVKVLQKYAMLIALDFKN